MDLRQFWRDYRNFRRSPIVADAGMSFDSVCALAAVALELGVGEQEAMDGTWRQRFEVMDEPPLRIGEQDCD